MYPRSSSTMSAMRLRSSLDLTSAGKATILPFRSSFMHQMLFLLLRKGNGGYAFEHLDCPIKFWLSATDDINSSAILC
jgi:hypothetical protein